MRTSLMRAVVIIGLVSPTFELIAGLFGSPHRALIVSEMERRLTSDPPVSSDFVRALDLLHRLR